MAPASTSASAAGSAAAGSPVGSSAASVIVDSVRGTASASSVRKRSTRTTTTASTTAAIAAAPGSTYPVSGRTVVNTTSARVSSPCTPFGAGATSSHANAKPSRHGSIAGIIEFVGVSLSRRDGANGIAVGIERLKEHLVVAAAIVGPREPDAIAVRSEIRADRRARRRRYSTRALLDRLQQLRRRRHGQIDLAIAVALVEPRDRTAAAVPNARSGYFERMPSSAVSRASVARPSASVATNSSSTRVSACASNTTHASPVGAIAALRFHVVSPAAPRRTGAPRGRPSTLPPAAPDGLAAVAVGLDPRAKQARRRSCARWHCGSTRAHGDRHRPDRRSVALPHAELRAHRAVVILLVPRDRERVRQRRDVGLVRLGGRGREAQLRPGLAARRRRAAERTPRRCRHACRTRRRRARRSKPLG